MLNLRNFVKKLVYTQTEKKLRAKSIMNGSHYNIGPSAGISLSDGSSKEDIILGDHVDIYGSLMSQNHGKIRIGNYSRIGRNTMIQSVDSIVIGNKVAIGREVTISDNNNHPTAVLYRSIRMEQPSNSEMHLWKFSDYKPIVIKDNVWVGEKARICKGVTIGKNCVIAACSVVTKDIPDNSIAAGNPAKVVKTDIDQLPNPTSCKTFNAYLKEHGSHIQ